MLWPQHQFDSNIEKTKTILAQNEGSKKSIQKRILFTSIYWNRRAIFTTTRMNRWLRRVFLLSTFECIHINCKSQSNLLNVYPFVCHIWLIGGYFLLVRLVVLISLWCRNIWFFRLTRWANVLSQWSHLILRLASCTRICLFRSDELVNPFRDVKEHYLENASNINWTEYYSTFLHVMQM